MLTEANVEAELSYAVLHAIASQAGFACEYRGRHADAAGIDATVLEDGDGLAPDSTLHFVSLDVQLKASYRDLHEANGKLSFPLTVPHYDKLRSVKLGSPRLLVVLRLPRNRAEWLHVTPEALVAKRCAYWVSVHGAPDIAGQKNCTVYVPTANVLTPDSLRGLMVRFSRQEVIAYAG